jgi:integral membrane protein (TIGR01906 family)
VTLSAEDPADETANQPAPPTSGEVPEAATDTPDPAATAAEATAGSEEPAAATPPVATSDAAPPAQSPAEIAMAAAQAAAEAAAAAQAAAARVAASSGGTDTAALVAEAAAAAAAAAESARIAMDAARSLGTQVPATTSPAGADPSAPAEPVAGAATDAEALAGPVTHVIPMPAPVLPPKPTIGRRLLGGIAALLIGVSTALVAVGLAVMLLLNPIWVSSEQERVESGTLTGFGPDELKFVTTSVLIDLIVGPPDFDVQVNGTPVFNEREVGHLRDVRNAFVIFGGVVLVAVVVLLVARFASRGSKAFYRRVRRGARWTAVLTLVVGLVGILAFGPAFELFHQLLFPAGTYIFDPAKDRLVQLFPEQFWIDSTVVLGGAIIVVAVAFGRWAGTRLADPKPSRLGAQGAMATGRTAG